MVFWVFSAFPYVHAWPKMVGSLTKCYLGYDRVSSTIPYPSPSLGRSYSNQGILLVLLTQTLTSHEPSMITWQLTEGYQEYPHVPRSRCFVTQFAGAFIQSDSLLLLVCLNDDLPYRVTHPIYELVQNSLTKNYYLAILQLRFTT